MVISGEGSEEKSYGEKTNLLKDYLSVHTQNVDRNMIRKGNSGEVSDGNENQGSEDWRKAQPCELAENLAEFCLF
jgi:hypothetical protein